MGTCRTSAGAFYRSFRRLLFPMLVLSLCITATVLYKSWDMVFFPKVHDSTAVQGQNQNTPVVGFTIPTKHTPSEASQRNNTTKTKPFSESRSSPEFPSKSSSHTDVQRPNLPERRRSLLIYGADRSGTTFTTKMFAEDPQILTVYEPLWVTKRWHVIEKDQKLPNWRRNVMNVVKGILCCKFAESEAGTRFLSYTSKPLSRAVNKNPFTSSAFFPNETWQDLSNDPNYTDDVCLKKYKHSVTKIGEPRTPDHLISSIVPALLLENPETDIRVIQLVRDPRGSFNSRIKLHWMTDYQKRNFPNAAAQQCLLLAQNIKFGRILAKWQANYLEVHYRDLAGKPIETTKLMYDFAGFEMPQSVLDWVVRNTSPSEEELSKEKNKRFSSVRNSTANVEKWQEESPIERIRIIEQQCSEVFDLLGLTKITSAVDRPDT